MFVCVCVFFSPAWGFRRKVARHSRDRLHRVAFFRWATENVRRAIECARCVSVACPVRAVLLVAVFCAGTGRRATTW